MDVITYPNTDPSLWLSNLCKRGHRASIIRLQKEMLRYQNEVKILIINYLSNSNRMKLRLLIYITNFHHPQSGQQNIYVTARHHVQRVIDVTLMINNMSRLSTILDRSYTYEPYQVSDMIMWRYDRPNRHRFEYDQHQYDFEYM